MQINLLDGRDQSNFQQGERICKLTYLMEQTNLIFNKVNDYAN